MNLGMARTYMEIWGTPIAEPATHPIGHSSTRLHTTHHTPHTTHHSHYAPLSAITRSHCSFVTGCTATRGIFTKLIWDSVGSAFNSASVSGRSSADSGSMSMTTRSGAAGSG